jgi:hypothetical protein
MISSGFFVCRVGCHPLYEQGCIRYNGDGPIEQENIMESTKTERQKEIDRDNDMILDHVDAICAAAQAGIHGTELEQMVIAMPLHPRTAKTAVMMMGKKRFLEKGYDRTRADAEWGEDWIDKVNEERRELTGMTE